jgi:O-antigen ligase
MKPFPGIQIRSAALPVSSFGIIATITAILISIAVVQRNIIVLTAITALALVILSPVVVSLGVFAVLVPFDQVLVLRNSAITITWIAGAFAGFTLIVYGLANGRFRSPPIAGLYWGLFVLWSATSALWAIDPLTSLKSLPTVATLFGFYIVAVSFRFRTRELARILFFTVAGGCFTAALIVLQFAYHLNEEGRASLILGDQKSNPNDLSFSLLLPFSFALAGALSQKNLFKRTVFLTAVGLIGVAIFLAMSRGSLIALSALMLVYLFRFGVSKRLLLPVLVLAIPLFSLPNLFYQRLAQASTSRGTGRYDVWLAGLEIVKRHPMTGVGLANFPLEYHNVAGYAQVFHGYTRVAHNTFLGVFGETGVIGVSLFMAAIWSQIKVMRRALLSHGYHPSIGIASEAACWGQLVMGLSGDIEWQKSFWFALTLLALIAQNLSESRLAGLEIIGNAPQL